MTDQSGVFVHLFRNKEAWKQNEGMFETAKGKFEAEEEHRKKLAAEAGLTEDLVKRGFNNLIDAKLFYPEMDYESKEYISWRSGWVEKDCVSSSKEQTANSDYTCGWPTEVLEELSLIKKHDVFRYEYFQYMQGANAAKYRFLYGMRGNKRCLVAWWGEKKYYDEIQEKLCQLKEKQEVEKREEKVSSKATKENSWSFDDKACAVVIALIVVTIIGVVVWSCFNDTKELPNRYKTASVETKENLTSETHKTECILNEYVEKSIYNLKPGCVVEKKESRCSMCDVSIYLIYRKDDGEPFAIGELVTKEIYSKLKIGDKIPFKRPEY